MQKGGALGVVVLFLVLFTVVTVRFNARPPGGPSIAVGGDLGGAAVVGRGTASGVEHDIATLSDSIGRINMRVISLNAEVQKLSQAHSDSAKRAAAAAATPEATVVHTVYEDVPVADQSGHVHGHKSNTPNDDTIFVSIASYRDEVCGFTVSDLYKKALNPKRVHCGIVEQHELGEHPCVPDELRDCQKNAFCPSDNIRVRRIAPKDAKGPTFGRYMAWLMYRGEKYFMMLDSHNTFVTHWDFIVIDMYTRRIKPGVKAVLSHYPEGWEKDNPRFKVDNRTTTTYMCAAKFIGQGYPRFDGWVVRKAKRPRPQPWAAAGFLFAHSQMVHEVPFDPHLDYIFDGEEIAYAARMYTHGWDVFSPNENILFHYYYRPKSKKLWGEAPQGWYNRRRQAEQRVQWLLGSLEANSDRRKVAEDIKDPIITADADKYGLGKVRTLKQYWEWAGVDMAKHTLQKDKFCAHQNDAEYHTEPDW